MAAMSASAAVKVTGQVVDDQDEPIIGASVTVPGSNAAAVTDIDGHFTEAAHAGFGIAVAAALLVGVHAGSGLKDFGEFLLSELEVDSGLPRPLSAAPSQSQRAPSTSTVAAAFGTAWATTA